MEINVTLTIVDLASGELVIEQRFDAPPVAGCPFTKKGMMSALWVSTPALSDVATWTRDIAPELEGVPPLRLIANFLAKETSTASMRFSHDGMRLAIVSQIGGTIQVWDVRTGAELLTIEENAEGERLYVDDVHFSPDDRYLLTTYERSNHIWVWDAQTGEQVSEFWGQDDFVSTFDFLPDGETVLTANHNHTDKNFYYPTDPAARMWNMTTGEEIRTFEHPDDVIIGAYFAADYTQVISVARESVRVWDTETGDLLHEMTTEFLSRGPVVLTPDETYVIAASDSGMVHVIDPVNGEVVHELTGFESRVIEMAISPDGRYLAASDGSGEVMVWSLPDGEQLHSMDLSWPVNLSMSPDSRYLLTVSQDAALWDLTSGEAAIELVGVGGYLGVGRLSPDGTLVAANRGQRILMWDVADLYND
jgi:WD40 repeat protein